jgi:hypothetical protein
MIDYSVRGTSAAIEGVADAVLAKLPSSASNVWFCDRFGIPGPTCVVIIIIATYTKRRATLATSKPIHHTFKKALCVGLSAVTDRVGEPA